MKDIDEKIKEFRKDVEDETLGYIGVFFKASFILIVSMWLVCQILLKLLEVSNEIF